MEYSKAKKILEKIVVQKVDEIADNAEKLGLTEDTVKLFCEDIAEAWNVFSDIGEMKDLVHDDTKQYNHAMDLAFEVWSNDLYKPTPEEILAGIWRRVVYFSKKENHLEMRNEGVSTFDVYENEKYKKDE